MLLDVFVAIVILISALIGMLRGFVREVMTLLGVACGFALSWIIAPLISPTIAKWLGAPDPSTEDAINSKFLDIIPYDLAATAIAWCAIIIITIILVSIISHILAEATKASGLGMADGAIGAIFGIARGLVIVVVLYLPVAVLVDAKLKEQWLVGGVTYDILEASSAKILPLLPGLEEEETKEEEATTSPKEEKPTPKEKEKDSDNTQKAQPTNGYEEESRDSMDSLIQIYGREQNQ